MKSARYLLIIAMMSVAIWLLSILFLRNLLLNKIKNHLRETHKMIFLLPVLDFDKIIKKVLKKSSYLDLLSNSVKSNKDAFDFYLLEYMETNFKIDLSGVNQMIKDNFTDVPEGEEPKVIVKEGTPPPDDILSNDSDDMSGSTAKVQGDILTKMQVTY